MLYYATYVLYKVQCGIEKGSFVELMLAFKRVVNILVYPILVGI